jgi:hypothetical protein
MGLRSMASYKTTLEVDFERQGLLSVSTDAISANAPVLVDDILMTVFGLCDISTVLSVSQVCFPVGGQFRNKS